MAGVVDGRHGKFKFPGGRDALAMFMKVADGRGYRLGFQPFESRVEDTLTYLESLSEEDGEALLRYDPDRKWIGIGLPFSTFGQYVAIVLPSGYERFVLDQLARGINPTISKGVLDIMPCARDGDDCDLINDMLGRTDYAMAVFFYYLLRQWDVLHIGEFVQKYLGMEIPPPEDQVSNVIAILGGEPAAMFQDRMNLIQEIKLREGGGDRDHRIPPRRLFTYLWNDLLNQRR